VLREIDFLLKKFADEFEAFTMQPCCAKFCEKNM